MVVILYRNVLAVASAYKDRILVVDTGRISSRFHAPDDNKTDILDCWGSDSIEELAAIYRAGPIIKVANSDSEDEECEDMIFSSPQDVLPDQLRYRLVERVHEQCAKKIADWFSLLHKFSRI